MENLTAKDVVIENQQTVYQGYFQLKQYNLRHRLFAGGWSDNFSRELFVRGHSVGILLFDPRRDEVVLIRQFRIGALDSEKSPWLIELVAGVIDDGDDNAEAVVRRETHEEAGLTVTAIKSICDYWVSPGGSSERMHVFCGLVDAEHAGGIHGLAHEHEDIEVFVWARLKAQQAIVSGEIDNASTIIALQWLQLHADKLQQQWLPAIDK